MDVKKRKAEDTTNNATTKKVAMMDTEEAENVVMANDSGINPDFLRIYYDRLFPCSLMYTWLSCGDPELIKRREFSFTLKDDVYIRYCSFTSKDEFKAGLLKKVPYKIDIGAVFNAPPNLHDSIPSFKPVSKEFVLDIDMTDYDDVRTCCSGADICIRCWPLMTAALRVVEHTLKNDFGFKHMLFVYSGRRGIHCWVCDRAAREMSNSARSAVIEYLSVYMGSDSNKMPEVRFPVHPTLGAAYDTLQPYFDELVESQGWFDTEEGRKGILDLLRIEKADDREFFEWNEKDVMRGDGVTRWKTLQEKILRKVDTKGKNTIPGLRTALASIVFLHCYPRLDINVSKQLNHLLKSPFCVHPKTGRVCVPIDPSRADDFSPFEVPTLNGLFNELNKQPATAGTKTKSWMGTSLAPHIEYFREFVKGVTEENQQFDRATKTGSGAGVSW